VGAGNPQASIEIITRLVAKMFLVERFI